MIIAWGLLIFGSIYFLSVINSHNENTKLYGRHWWHKKEYQHLKSNWVDLLPLLTALCSAQYIWG